MELLNRARKMFRRIGPRDDEIDAADALSGIMVNGQPDRGRFVDSVSRVLESAGKATRKEHPRVAIFGECAGLLCAAGDLEGAIQIEQTGRELLSKFEMALLCAYPLADFHLEQEVGPFTSICSEHSAVFSR